MSVASALDNLAMELDPSLTMEAAGLPPDDWQRDVLRSEDNRLLLLCCRQSGKSTVAAARGLHRALFKPRSLVVIVAPSQRQSSEMFRKLATLYRDFGRPVPTVQESMTSLALANGSRVVTLPSSPETVRGYSGVDLLIVDEAAMVDDAVFGSVSPMLATSRGDLIAMTTPLGKRGWFFKEWAEGGDVWKRVRVTAEMCPRITPEFLAEQRGLLGDRWYRQEWLCSFEEAVGQVFATDAVNAAFQSDEAPLFGVA